MEVTSVVLTSAKRIPYNFLGEKGCLLAKGDLVYDSKLGREYTLGSSSTFINKAFKNSNLYVISFADRSNIGASPKKQFPREIKEPEGHYIKDSYDLDWSLSNENVIREWRPMFDLLFILYIELLKDNNTTAFLSEEEKYENTTKLDDAGWDSLMGILENPPKPTPALVSLMRKEEVFDNIDVPLSKCVSNICKDAERFNEVFLKIEEGKGINVYHLRELLVDNPLLCEIALNINNQFKK